MAKKRSTAQKTLRMSDLERHLEEVLGFTPGRLFMEGMLEVMPGKGSLFWSARPPLSPEEREGLLEELARLNEALGGSPLIFCPKA